MAVSRTFQKGRPSPTSWARLRLSTMAVRALEEVHS
jgi:hypothetical protein